MDGSRGALEQLGWSRYDYGMRLAAFECSATINHHTVATVHDVPAGWAARICCLEFGKPGAHKVFDTYEEARGYVEQWFSGLDIVPW